MKPAMILPAAVFLLATCAPTNRVAEKPAREETAEPADPIGSEALAAHFPLLPLIEKSLWRELLEAEARQAASPPESAATGQIIARLSGKLRSRHPFKADDNTLELGGIACDKKDGRLSLPARVHFPDPGDERHPGEVELLLCSTTGRTHETLFITEARPLHLELLLHLSGHTKGSEASRFRIDILSGNGTRVPAHSLIRAKDGVNLPTPLFWEFSGSDYRDLYSPDLSGDFAIFWHAHDSVLRVAHEGIASGEVKLEAVPHPALKNGDPVVLEFIPATTEGP